jgi:hypothetical protein
MLVLMVVVQVQYVVSGMFSVPLFAFLVLPRPSKCGHLKEKLEN